MIDVCLHIHIIYNVCACLCECKSTSICSSCMYVYVPYGFGYYRMHIFFISQVFITHKSKLIYAYAYIDPYVMYGESSLVAISEPHACVSRVTFELYSSYILPSG